MPATWFPHGISPAGEQVHVREDDVRGVYGHKSALSDARVKYLEHLFVPRREVTE